MSDIQRYIYCPFNGEQKCDNGRYVLFKDVEPQLSAALARIKELERENKNILFQYNSHLAECAGVADKASIEAEAIRKAEPYVREMMAIDLGGVLLAKRMINDTIRAYNDYANNINKG